MAPTPTLSLRPPVIFTDLPLHPRSSSPFRSVLSAALRGFTYPQAVHTRFTSINSPSSACSAPTASSTSTQSQTSVTPPVPSAHRKLSGEAVTAVVLATMALFAIAAALIWYLREHKASKLENHHQEAPLPSHVVSQQDPMVVASPSENSIQALSAVSEGPGFACQPQRPVETLLKVERFDGTNICPSTSRCSSGDPWPLKNEPCSCRAHCAPVEHGTLPENAVGRRVARWSTKTVDSLESASIANARLVSMRSISPEMSATLVSTVSRSVRDV